MSKRKKRLERAKQNPKSVSFEEMRQIFEDWGYKMIRSSGSHFVFEHDETKRKYTIPFRRPTLLPSYVRDALVQIESIIQSKGGSDDE